MGLIGPGDRKSVQPMAERPPPSREALASLGETVRLARRRRRQTAADLAARLDVSLPTFRKLERGDPSVSLGTFVTALWLLDLLDNFTQAIHPDRDRTELALEIARMPQRIRRTKAEAELDDF
jgi:transcriptional regulator with XRE-family HTH domain